MTDLQILVLSLIQGITEFLPVSSSAHLIITSNLFGWRDQGLAIDVAVHFGTLIAVIMYFKEYVMQGINGGFDLLGKRKTEDSQFALLIIIATIPVVICGFIFKDFIATAFRENMLYTIAITSIVFGVLLWFIDYATPTFSKVSNLNYKHGLFLGICQTIALIPGVSRSGICMTAARLLNMERTESAKISMLMGMPTLFAASILVSFDIYKAGDILFTRGALLAIIISFLFAYLTIGAMMKLLEKTNMTIFAVYRIALGIILLVYFV
ncbi:MAG: undecaprenyl-diphosphate phosphatase [Alphaproteobacteria bacterium]